MFRIGFGLSFLTALQALLAFGIHWLVVTQLGMGEAVDAFFASLSVPQLGTAMTTSSLIHVLEPLFAVASPDTHRLREEGWTVLFVLTSLVAGFAVLLWLFAPRWVPWTVPGFSPAVQRLTVDLARIQLIGMVALVPVTVLAAACNAAGRFLRAAIAPLIAAGVSLICLLHLLPDFGVIAAAWAFSLIAVLQLPLLVTVLGPVQRPRWHAPVLGHVWVRLRPLLLGSSYARLGTLVDRLLASLLPPGSVASLSLAQRIYETGLRILGAGLVTPVVPKCARLVAQKQWWMFQRVLRQRLLAMTLLLAACLLLLAGVGKPLLGKAFLSQAIDHPTVQQLWILLIGLSGMFIGGGIGRILSMAFYVQGNTWIPTIVGAVGFTLGILLKIAGCIWFGLIGIAVGVALHYLINVGLFQWHLRRNLSLQIHLPPSG